MKGNGVTWQTFDLQHIKLLIGKTEPSVFKEFMDKVGNQSLLAYRAYLQWGGKKGKASIPMLSMAFRLWKHHVNTSN